MEEAPDRPPGHSHFPGSGRGEALTTDTDLSAGELLGEVTLPMPRDPDTTIRIEGTLLEAGVADGPVLVEVAGDLQVGEHDREVSVVLTRGEVAWQSPEGRQRSRTALLHFRDLAADGGVGLRRNVEVSGPERDSLVLEDPTAADHGLVVEWVWSDVSDLGPAPEEADGACGPDESIRDCCLLEITFICIPREARDLEVSEVAATGELRVRVYRGVERGAELSVTCEPGEPVRGEEITCRAETDPEDAELAVKRWSFEGGGHTVEAERTQPTWQGRMVVSGTVTVTAAVAGEDTTASTEVAVQPRAWSGRRVEFSASEQEPSGLDPAPDALSDLGKVRLQAELTEGFLETAEEGSGPNDGLFYLTEIPIGASATVRVNRNALTEGSAFWRLQPRSAPRGRCDRSDVEPFVPVILAHEGLPLPAGPKSHIGLFRNALDSLSRNRFEPLTAPSRAELFDGPVRTIFRDVIWPTAKRAQARADDPANAPSYCQFRFFNE